MNSLPNIITKINNCIQTNQKYTLISKNRFHLKILRVLFLNGLIFHFSEIKSKQMLKIYFKYNTDGTPSFKKIKILSKSSKKCYLSYNELTKMSQGISLIIISTKQGLLTHHACLKLKIGGKALCYIT